MASWMPLSEVEIIQTKGKTIVIAPTIRTKRSMVPTSRARAMRRLRPRDRGMARVPAAGCNLPLAFIVDPPFLADYLNNGHDQNKREERPGEGRGIPHLEVLERVAVDQ